MLRHMGKLYSHGVTSVPAGIAVIFSIAEGPVSYTHLDVYKRQAQMLGIEAEDFTTEQAPVTEEQYTGRCEAYVSEKKFENFKKKPISPDDLYQVNETGERLPVELVPNQFVILKADQSVKKTQLGRFDGKHVVPLKHQRKKPYGVSPRNVGQKFLQEALLTGPEEAPLMCIRDRYCTVAVLHRANS